MDAPGRPSAWVQWAIGVDREECLLWPFSVDVHGYGHFKFRGKMSKAHRAICILVNGEPSLERYEVAHTCGVPACCNKRHLRFASRAENEADKVLHGTVACGERHGFSKLTAMQARVIRRMNPAVSAREIAPFFGISKQNFNHVRAGRFWKVA